MRNSARAALAPATLAVIWLVPALAAAQSIDIVAPASRPDASHNSLRSSIDASPAAPGDDAALAAALNYDPLQFSKPPKKPLTSFAAKKTDDFKWTGNTKPDGSGSVGFNKTLHTEWDMKVGGDMSLDGDPWSGPYDPRQPLVPGLTKEQRSRDAWANVAVPDVANVELRVAPSDDRRKVGTSVQRSVPIGSSLSVIMQNDLSFTENVPGAAPLPPLAAPVPGQVWDNAQKLKLNIARTGTTFAAAASNSSLDPVTHHTLSAEQKIYGNLNVTTAITDPGQSTVSKSIKAGLKFDW